ncbi:hypothetical protein [Pediococcus pentosaceus]|uniref:hypothetical protein n=1 Tax=Pediococcus pentosaceus TaxID=1255 RepID=UPI00223AA380|nr:hypothetical protein [Pediococcus pentosaceus]MCS8573803.1 hypothetical protein [Pediococcus pentosaceus]
MLFKERQMLRKQALFELNKGNSKKYEELMRKARTGIPEHLSLDFGEPREKVMGSRIPRIIKRRKEVKSLIKFGYNKKAIARKCGVTEGTITSDIRALKKSGNLVISQEV